MVVVPFMFMKLLQSGDSLLFFASIRIRINKQADFDSKWLERDLTVSWDRQYVCP